MTIVLFFSFSKFHPNRTVYVFKNSWISRFKIHSHLLPFMYPHIMCATHTYILSTNDATINNIRENEVDDKNVHSVACILTSFCLHYVALCCNNFSIYYTYFVYISFGSKIH